jgi:hypothetical protein
VSDSGPNIDEILEELRRTVAERSASGQYPDGLEDELDAHFHRIIASRPQLPRLAMLRRRIEAARRASRFSPDRIPTISSLPGGEVLHRAMSRVFLRQAHGILLQVQEFADRTLEAFDAAASVAERPNDHRHAELVEILDAHSELLAPREKLPAGISERLDDVLSRVERLEGAEADRNWQPWFSRSRFEMAFDGGVPERVQVAAATALAGISPLLDVGALDARYPQDTLSAIAACGDGSLGGVVLLQAEDHLRSRDVVDLIRLSSDRLRQGGRLVISVGSPVREAQGSSPLSRPPFNPMFGAPLPLAYTVFACREAGFHDVETQQWDSVGYLTVATR